MPDSWFLAVFSLHLHIREEAWGLWDPFPKDMISIHKGRVPRPKQVSTRQMVKIQRHSASFFFSLEVFKTKWCHKNVRLIILGVVNAF